MDSGRTRYEILVATLLNKASLASFRFHATTTVVPGRTVYRLRVPAGRDLSEVVHRLTDHDVQVLEIRQCVQADPDPGVADTAPPAEPPEPAGDPGTVVSFPTARAVARPERTPGPADRPAHPEVEARDPAEVATTAARARPDRRGHLRAVPC